MVLVWRWTSFEDGLRLKEISLWTPSLVCPHTATTHLPQPLPSYYPQLFRSPMRSILPAILAAILPALSAVVSLKCSSNLFFPPLSLWTASLSRSGSILGSYFSAIRDVFPLSLFSALRRLFIKANYLFIQIRIHLITQNQTTPVMAPRLGTSLLTCGPIGL